MKYQRYLKIQTIIPYGLGAFILLGMPGGWSPDLWAKGIGRDGPEQSARQISQDSGKGKETCMTDTETLTEEEGRYLLSVARKTIDDALSNRKDERGPGAGVSEKFSERRGTFVTLTIEHNLRGCIGHIIPQESLLEGIRINALNAAFRDPRFRALTKREWEKVKIEISILTEAKSLDYADGGDLLEKLRPGIDGVILKKGYCQATFLPQVWEQLPDKKEFLSHLCMKAGLDHDAWKKEELEVSVYQVQAFEE